MNAIEVRDIKKSYPGFELRNVSFTLPEGAILGLVGENGAGKSTLIRLIMGAAGRDGARRRCWARTWGARNLRKRRTT